jgi:hypothetical protein
MCIVNPAGYRRFAVLVLVLVWLSAGYSLLTYIESEDWSTTTEGSAYTRQPVRSRHKAAGRDYYRSHLLSRGCRWLTMTRSLAARDGKH